jgi:hypothetical protein
MRAAVLLLATAAAAAALLPLVPSRGTGGPDGLIVVVASWLAIGPAAYLLLCVGLTSARQLLAPAPADQPVHVPAGTPQWLRRLLAVALGVTVMATTSGLASADETPHHRPGAPQLGWPVATSPTLAPPSVSEPRQPVADARAGDVVVVGRGDTLWSIAARATPPPATAAAVAAAWPRWWRANRDVIGPDPSLIRPGQQLRAPADPTPLDLRSQR